MSVELIQRLFHAVDNSGWAAMQEIFDKDVVYERPGYEPFEGLERVLHFYKHERVLASGKHCIDQIVVDGDYCACWGQFIGFRKDNAPVDVLFADVYYVDKGKIKKRRSYFFQPSV